MLEVCAIYFDYIPLSLNFQVVPTSKKSLSQKHVILFN